jgi:hypothetical protein
MSQTAYLINIPAVSYPGQIADDSEVKDVLSAAAYAAAMVYGTLAITDETNTVGFDQLACRAPSASGDITVIGAQLGVVLADQARAQNPAVSTPQYPQFAMVPCMRKGRVWVNAETAMTDGAAPFVRFASGAGGTVLGSFRNSADTASAAQMPSTQAVVRGTTTGAGYAVIELDLV